MPGKFTRPSTAPPGGRPVPAPRCRGCTTGDPFAGVCPDCLAARLRLEREAQGLPPDPTDTQLAHAATIVAPTLGARGERGAA